MPAIAKVFYPCGLIAGGLWFAFTAGLNAQPYTFTTIAGLGGQSGTADGTNRAARFFRPSGLAVDGAGNIYVADLLNHTIRKVAPTGTDWVVSTLAGLAGTAGSADGTNGQARFDHPSAVAVDGVGNLFVADTYNHTIRKITPAGTNWLVSTIAGLAGHPGSDDGTNDAAQFNDPQALAVDGSGRLYVADRLNCTIRGVTPVGTNWVVATLAGTPDSIYGGFKDGRNDAAEFNLPFGIARHSSGDLYVADFGNNAIRQISPRGPDWVTTTVAGFSGNTGSTDGPARDARFSSPNGIGVDAAATLYVADQYNYAIRKLEPSGSSWMVSTVGGQVLTAGTNDGVGASARFYWPWGIALDGTGGFFVADSGNHTIRRAMLLSSPAPALHIVMVGNQVVLSWSITASNYVLETSSTLGPGASWTALTSGVAVAGNNYVLTNDIGAASGFFRLRVQ